MAVVPLGKMKTLEEIIALLSVQKYMDCKEHPLTKDEISDALWYLRNYKDLLLDMQRVCQDTEYIKEHFLKDLKK